MIARRVYNEFVLIWLGGSRLEESFTIVYELNQATDSTLLWRITLITCVLPRLSLEEELKESSAEKQRCVLYTLLLFVRP